MIPYPTYKSTDLPWLPKIPEHWDIFPIRSIARVKSITDQVEKELLSVYLGRGVVRFSDIKEKRTNVTSLDLSKYQLVEPGDFVLNNQQAWRGSVGVSALTGIVSPAYFVLKMSDILNSRFANYLLRSPAMVNYYYVSSKGIGSIQRNLVWQQLKAFSIAIPSLAEQEQIVRYLDSMTAKINKLIRAKKKQIALLQEQRQAIINQTVTKGLDPNVEMKDSGIRWGKTIPKHWQVMKAKYCVTINHGCDPITEGNIPVYGSGAESFKTCGEFKEGPAVLVGRKGATLHIPHFVSGKYWNVDTAFDVKNRNGFSLRFYFYLAKCFDYEYYISQTTLPGMTQTSYLNMKLPVPSFSEQNEIVGYLDDICRKYDFVIDKLNGEINLATEYKNRLISSVVTGQIDVRNIPVEDVIPNDLIAEDEPTTEIEEEPINESEE